MKIFGTTKRKLSLLLILAIVLQLVGPSIMDTVFANKTEGDIEEIETEVEDSTNLEEEDEEIEEDEKIEEETPGEEIEEQEEETTEKKEEYTNKSNLTGLFGLITPLSDGGKDLGSEIFKDIHVEVNGEKLSDETITEVEITDGLQLKVTLDWTLADDVTLNDGDWAELQLPATLSGVSSSTTGDLLDGVGAIVGTYEITTEGNLKVIFNEELVGKKERAGEVGLLMNFDAKKFEDDVNQKLEFGEPINKTFDFKVKPSGNVHDLKKYGMADATTNPKYINWTLDVNTKLDTLKNASIEDVIPKGLILDLDSVEVYELTVGSKGKLTEGAKINPTVSGTEDVLKIELGQTDKAYRIKYKTDIEDFEKSYRNDAILKDDGKDKATDYATVGGLEQGSLIEKEGWENSQNKDQVIWRIYVNKAESSLNNVNVLDQLPKGLDIQSINVWQLNKSGNEWKFGDWVKEQNKFPVELGNIDGAYVLEIISDINYSQFQEYTKELVFKNIAELEINYEVVDEDDATVTVERGNLLEKSGKDTTSYGDSKISWTVTVNKAKHTITGATITDTIGQGLELMENSVKVFDSANQVLDPSQYTFTKTDNGFTLNLGDISSEYRIEYDTKIIKNLVEGQTGYTNKAELSGSGLGGSGVGVGDTTKEPTVNPSKFNTYKKETVNNKSIGNDQNKVIYDGLNYNAKTMSWKLTVDAIKEEITELKIKDYFGPEKSMKFIEDSLRVVIGNRVLVKGTDYTLTGKGVDGFELDFIGEHKPLERAKYEIYFKTSFDPNLVLDGKGVLNTTNKYTNHVNYTGKTKDLEGNRKDLDEKDQAEYRVHEDYTNHGKKHGVLDRENRTIAWQIFSNASGRDLIGGPFTITDKLADSNQTVNEDVKVYEYSLDKDGNQIKGEEITEGFEVVYDTDMEGFKVIFANGVKVPVLVEFTSKINGKSEEWYKNQAVVADITEQEKIYPAQVKYDNHDKFINKEALNVDGNTVYTDDEIDWKISLNESLSNINNAVFEDQLSKGLVLVNDSIKIYKGSIAENNLQELEEKNIVIKANNDGTRLTINLGDIKETRYYITYTTVVVSTEGKISNSASLSGYEEKFGDSGKKEYNAKQSSWGTGSGKENRGQIEIVKVDKDNNDTKLSGAKFQLYYLLNDEEQIVTGQEQVTDTEGKIQYGNLPFRTYYLRELEAPEGYKVLKEEIEIAVDKENQKVELNVQNTKKSYAIGDYTWIDTNKDGIQDENEAVLPGVIVELYDETGETKLAETATDENGLYVFDELEAGKYKIKFTLTKEQAELYEFTKQNEGDDSAVDSDAHHITGWTEVIKLDDDNKELTTDYEEQEFNATEGIDPTWDAGVILRERIEITGSKVWIGGPKEKPTIELQLYRNGEEFGEPVKLEDGETEYTWENLYKTDRNKEEYEYTVKEVGVPSEYNKTEEGLTVTNTRKTYAIGDYTWIDSNKDGIQDDEEVLAGVIVELYYENGEPVLNEDEEVMVTNTDENGLYIFDELEAGNYRIKFVLTEEQAAKYEFTKLSEEGNEEADSNANPVAGDDYGWTQVIKLNEDNEYLSKDYTDQNFKATEGIDPTWDAGVILREKIDIFGSKTWDDADNQDGKRPKSITIKLLADGKELDRRIVSAEDDWSWSFTDLYKSNAGSDTDILYTIVEEAIEGYSAKIEGYNVTNSHTPGKTSVQVMKTWVGKSEEAVTVKLLADGEDTELTLTLSEENNWTDTFTELDEYKAGQKIEYTVEEVDVDGYNTEITGDAKEGFVITNTRKTYAIGDYTWIDSNKDGIQDKDEEVLVGVKVELFDKDGEKVAETFTDENGLYIFDELEAGSYKIKFTLTEKQARRYKFTKQNVGEDSRLDSDADPETGWTKEIVLDDGNDYLTKEYENQEVKATQGIDPTWDAGVVRIIPKEPVIEKDIDGNDKKDVDKYDEVFTYNVSTQIPEDISGYETLLIMDILEEVLDIKSVEVQLNGKRSRELEKYLNIDKNMVSLLLDADEGFDFAMVAGKTISILIKSQIIEGADLSEYEDKSIPNTASYILNDSTIETLSNTVIVNPPKPEDPEKPDLPKTGAASMIQYPLMGLALLGLGLGLKKKKEDE